jgi:hypothetical protein
MKPSWYLSRRTVLRSAGTSLALPFLDAMVRPGRAVAAGGSGVRRFVAVFGLPNGVVAKRDELQNCAVAPWTPAAAGSIVGLAPDRYLKPFFEKKLESKITLLTGLTHKQGDSHFCGPFISPVSLKPGPLDNYTQTANAGPTMDVLIGNYFKRENPSLMPTLVLTSQSGYRAKVMHNHISFGANHQPLPVERNPRAAFETLFGTGVLPDTQAGKAELARRRMEDKSVLDFVTKDANSLMQSGRLGRGDRSRLDEYLTGVRELEQRLNAAPPPLSCKSPGQAPPAPDISYLSSTARLGQRVKDMTDLIVKAFECDRTRAVSYMLSRSYGQTGYPELGLTGSHHTRSHYQVTTNGLTLEQNKAWVDKYTEWALARYAYLLAELDSKVEPDGTTLLDNSVVLLGSDVGDSHLHSLASMPLILGGRGGRSLSGQWAIKAGRHVRYPKWRGNRFEQENHDAVRAGLSPSTPEPGERTLHDLHLGVLKAMGLGSSTFGDSKNPIDLANWSDAVAS